MCTPMKIVKCGKCGCHAEIAIDTQSDPDMYVVRCSKCDRQSRKALHLEDAILDWTEINKPLKVKPRYYCGICGEEVPFGFQTCLKCGTIIDWS